MSWAGVAADTIVLLHAAYVGFVVLGFGAIVAGLVFRRPWARNFWFRMIHLLAIGVVVVEALWGISCPLTVWEGALRRQAGQVSPEGDFVGHWTHRLIFFDAPPWVFTLLYLLFGASVLVAFLVGPPRRPDRNARAGDGTPLTS